MPVIAKTFLGELFSQVMRIGQKARRLLHQPYSHIICACHAISTHVRIGLGNSKIIHEGHHFWELPTACRCWMLMKEESSRFSLDAVELYGKQHMTNAFVPQGIPFRWLYL